MFLLLLVCSADFDIFCSGLFSHHVKFSSLMFMQKVLTRMVCVNGKNPVFIVSYCTMRPYWERYRFFH